MGLLRQPTIARLTNYIYIYISFSQALSMMFHDSFSQVLLGSWIRMEKTPQHSPRQTKEILCMKDPPPGLPDSVSLTWHLLRPKPGRVWFKNEHVRMVWRLPTSGNPYRSLINMVEFWGMIFWDVGDLFFVVSQDGLQMANELNWLVSTILWTFNYHVILSHLSKQNQYLSWRCHKVCRSFARNLTRMQEPSTCVFRA